MSGTIGRITSTIQGLYDSLLDASFRGVTFSIIDHRHEVGRRVQRFLFPGRDDADFQDLGAFDGPIRITGLVSGDDYIAQAMALHAAFRDFGVGTLVHPWLGELQVMLEHPATLSFSHGEFRIARFEATFLPFEPFAAPPADTLQSLLGAITDAKRAARAWLRKLLAPAIMPLALVAYANRTAGQIAGWWQVAAGGGLASNLLGFPAGLLGSAVGPQGSTAGAGTIGGAIGTLATPLALGAGWADTMVGNLTAVPDAIAAASVPVSIAAIGPGDAAVPTVAADPAACAGVLLSVGGQIAGLASDPSPGPGLAASLQAIAALDAAQAASDIQFASASEAADWRNRIVTALDAATDATVAQATPSGAAVAEAATLWRSLVTVRSAVVADISAEIGSLPAVRLVQIPTPAPLWLVALHLAGDRPGEIAASYRDLVLRNRVSHPGLPRFGTIEALR